MQWTASTLPPVSYMGTPNSVTLQYKIFSPDELELNHCTWHDQYHHMSVPELSFAEKDTTAQFYARKVHDPMRWNCSRHMMTSTVSNIDTIASVVGIMCATTPGTQNSPSRVLYVIGSTR